MRQFLFATGAAAAASLLASSSAEASCPGLASGYASRMPVQVSNPGAATGTYYAFLTVDSAAWIGDGTLKADGSDLLVTDGECNALPHWIQRGLGTSTTRVWVKVPSLPAGASRLNVFHGSAGAAHVNQAADVFGAGLVALYAFDEQDGATAADGVGGRDLTLTGSAWSPGIGGRGAVGGFSSGGSGNRLTAGSAGPALGTGAFSVVAAINPTAAGVSGNTRGIVGNYSNDGANGWVLKTQGGPGQFMLLTNQGGNWCQASGGTLTADKWQMVGARRDPATTNSLFQDGVKVRDLCPTDARDVVGAGTFEVGRGYGGSYALDGSVGFVAVFNRALADAEFAELYRGILPAVEPTLTLGSSVPDAPTITQSTAGAGDLSIAFDAPLFDGGQAITGYKLDCVPGGVITGAASPLSLASLPAGVPQSCRIIASNNNGDGVPSNPVSLTPGTASAITSLANLELTVGIAGSFPITAEGAPAPAITLEGALPAGVTFDGTSLAGTPAPGTAGAYPVLVRASNGIGSPAAQALSLVVKAHGQAIAFAAIEDRPMGSKAFQLSAIADSGLDVTITSLTPSVCAVATDVVTLIAAGTCVLSASQAGDDQFSAAVAVTQQFLITSASQVIAFGELADRAMHSPPFAVSATADSGLPVSIISMSPSVCSVLRSEVTILAVGTCVLAADQAGDAAHTAAATVIRLFQITDTTDDDGACSTGSPSSSVLVGLALGALVIRRRRRA